MESRKKSVITKGLVLGKFAPLHKGHQHLIQTAINACDIVYVVIYDSREIINIPLHIRADWIRHLYPNVIVIEAWDGPSESGKDPAIMKLQEDYLKRILPDTITHFFSSEWYGDHVSKALNAKNVTVDIKRKKYQISGTKIRKNPHIHREWLHPYVYKDFVSKVVFLGAESTGKTTIAHILSKIYKTSWMPEHGRDFWLKHKDNNGILTQKQLAQLAREHIDLENDALIKAHKFLFVDTNAITTEMFSYFYHGNADPELVKLAHQAQERYDFWFVCGTDIPYEDDGTRNGARHRKKFQDKIIKDLENRGIEYTLLEGALDQRIQTVRKIIN